MRTLMFCAVKKDRTVRRHEIAEACNASENHLAQVIHLMAQRGFIRTIRGRNGGLSLGRNAEDIVVGDVFRSFEAPLPCAVVSSAPAASARFRSVAACAAV
jgi:Rrf2 family nitric oxide-sensitive transcriptional repressor